MGRYSPQVPVQDNSGTILASAIERGIQGFLAARQLRHQSEDRERARELQDLQLGERGYHRGTAPTEPVTLTGGGFALATPTLDVSRPAGPLFDLSKINPVDRAPARYAQVTPSFYRDEQQVAGQTRQKAQAAFQQAMAQALAKAESARMGPRRSLGTLDVVGPGGTPLVANRFEDGTIEPTAFSPYERPAAAPHVARVYDASRGVIVDRDKGEVVRLPGLPRREFAPRSLGSTRRDPNIVTLERQIQETQRGLAPVAKELAAVESSAEPRAGRRLGELQERHRALLHRLDSLTAARDRRAGAQMGADAPAPSMTPPDAPGADRGAMEAEFARNAALYQRLLADPSVNAEEARRAYDESNAMVARRYGARSDR